VTSSTADKDVALSCPACGTAAKAVTADVGSGPPCLHCGHRTWFTCDDVGGVRVITVADRPQADLMGKLFKVLNLPAGARLVLDLADVHYLSSGALGQLLALQKRIASIHGGLKLRRVHPEVREIFRITRLIPVFEFEA
jgi:anti-anti-sigma factor